MESLNRECSTVADFSKFKNKILAPKKLPIINKWYNVIVDLSTFFFIFLSY
jgi:hypothetical protein